MDEVRESDVLIHVVDASHRFYQDQVDSVNETLNELLNEPKPVIFCFNKMDKLSSQNYDAIVNKIGS